jgi:hypothetical protein
LAGLSGTKKEVGYVESKKDLFASMKWEDSIVLFVAKPFANLFRLLSLFSYWRWYLAAHRKPIKPWMADTYVIVILAGLVYGLMISRAGNVSGFFVGFAVWVLADTLGSVIGDVLITPIKCNDQSMPYISVLDGPRWLILAFLNVIEVVLCFAALFLYYGQQFSPRIEEATTAIYFSLVTFISLGYGDIKPACYIPKMLVCCEISYFILFLGVRVPAAVSILRVKEEPTGPKQTERE